MRHCRGAHGTDKGMGTSKTVLSLRAVEQEIAAQCLARVDIGAAHVHPLRYRERGRQVDIVTASDAVGERMLGGGQRVPTRRAEYCAFDVFGVPIDIAVDELRTGGMPEPEPLALGNADRRQQFANGARQLAVGIAFEQPKTRVPGTFEQWRNEQQPMLCGKRREAQCVQQRLSRVAVNDDQYAARTCLR